MNCCTFTFSVYYTTVQPVVKLRGWRCEEGLLHIGVSSVKFLKFSFQWRLRMFVEGSIPQSQKWLHILAVLSSNEVDLLRYSTKVDFFDNTLLVSSFSLRWLQLCQHITKIQQKIILNSCDYCSMNNSRKRINKRISPMPIN